MFTKKALTGLVATATLMTGVAAVPAEAHRGHGYGHQRHYEDDDYYNYDNRGYYNDRRSYRAPRCDKGTGGTIIGGIAGGLAGRQIAGRGNRTEGVIIGAAVGALAGRAIDKADSNCLRRYR
jgi:Glycine zipper 2TM domain